MRVINICNNIGAKETLSLALFVRQTMSKDTKKGGT